MTLEVSLNNANQKSDMIFYKNHSVAKLIRLVYCLLGRSEVI